MARLVALSMVVIALVAVGRFVVVNAPRAEAASAGLPEVTVEPDQVEDEPPTDLASAVPSPSPVHFNSLNLARWESGAYRVGESLNPKEAKADRDIRSRDDPLQLDERLNGDVYAGYTGSQRGEIIPGLYSTDFGTTGCGYELWQVLRTTRAATLIGEEYVAEGRLLVTLNGMEPDWFIAGYACGDWYQWQPRPEPMAPAPSGDYWVGDLEPGRWFVPKDCLWEKTVAFRGALLQDVEASGHGPGVIEVVDEPMGLRVRGCTTPLSFVE